MDFNGTLSQVRSSLKEEGSVLNKRVFDKITDFFLLCFQDPQHSESLRQRSSEYSKIEKQAEKDREFFLNVDDNGLSHPTDILVQAFQTKADQYPSFHLWFSESQAPDDTTPVLLVARWLAHFAGFRHRCAHIFLDHPKKEDYTFVQLRSFSKADSPGCFDLPVGGHAKGCERIKKTAEKELYEELNLCLTNIDCFDSIGSYNYNDPPKRPDFHNVEHRTVFWGRLQSQSLSTTQFSDGEVAALCMFSIPELSILLEQFPERAGSGLIGSLHVYLQHKIKKRMPQLADLVQAMKGSQFNRTLLDIFRYSN